LNSGLILFAVARHQTILPNKFLAAVVIGLRLACWPS
jgi:hypothetical protein